MIKTKKKIINGKNIEVTQFPARKQLEYKFQLIQTLGVPVINLITSIDRTKSLSDQNISSEAITKAISSLFINISPSGLVDLMLQFFACTRVDGHELDENYMNVEFSGEMIILYKIFIFVIEVNYDSFLGIIHTTLDKLGGKDQVILTK
jgi:hypothetical protein